MKHAAKSLVEVGKNQYSNFSSNSIVNCNDVFPTTIDKIVLKLKNNQLKIKNDMDIAIVEDLRKAVCDSPLVDPEIIDMLID